MRQPDARTRFVPPRQSRAGHRRVRTSLYTHSAPPPRDKWRPNWDLAPTGKSYHHSLSLKQFVIYTHVYLWSTQHPRFVGVVTGRSERPPRIEPPDKNAATVNKLLHYLYKLFNTEIKSHLGVLIDFPFRRLRPRYSYVCCRSV